MSTKQELVDKAGDVGTLVLDGAAMAADDLEKTGIIAKDGEATASEAETKDGAEPELTPEIVDAKDDKPDLQAMKAAIDQLRSQPAEQADPADIAQLRERVATLEATVSELAVKLDIAAVAAKALGDEMLATKELRTQLAALRQEHTALRQEHDESLDVTTGLFDLVMGFQTGQKQVAIERNGDASVHDPAGLALQKQMEAVAEKAAASGAGEYAGEKLFPVAS